MNSFSFDDDALRKIAEDAVREVAAQQTADLERLTQQHAGQPLDVIRPALQQLFARYDGSITEPELTEWAEHIQNGTHIEITATGINWTR